MFSKVKIFGASVVALALMPVSPVQAQIRLNQNATSESVCHGYIAFQTEDEIVEYSAVQDSCNVITRGEDHLVGTLLMRRTGEEIAIPARVSIRLVGETTQMQISLAREGEYDFSCNPQNRCGINEYYNTRTRYIQIYLRDAAQWEGIGSNNGRQLANYALFAIGG